MRIKVAYHRELLFGLAEKIETTLKNCLKVGIDANFELTGGITGGLEPGKTVPEDKCKDLIKSDTSMFLYIHHNLF